MNGLPTNINLNELIGAELLQICIGGFQCILNFDKDINLSIECECIYDSGEGEKLLITDYTQNAALLCNLIDKNISHAARSDDGGLLIRFSNHVVLHLLNNNGHYESFQVNIKGQTFVA